MRVVYRETVIDTQSCYKILLLNGFSLSRAKQKLLRRRKGLHESFWSRRKSRKSLAQTIPWQFAVLVKNYLGIIVFQRPIDPRQTAQPSERYAEPKKKRLLCTVAKQLG